jgi:hypothetical protein
MAGRAITAAACAAPAGARAGSLVQVAAVADAAPTTESAPAATRAMALDRLDGTVRCRGKGTFPWFAYHARCFTPDSNCHIDVAGICAWDLARVRAPGSL